MLRDGTSIPGQLTELSAGGCYIHTLEPIAIGTPFQLRIKGGIRSCELRGKAIYMHSGSGFGIFGIGVRFESMAADQRSSLEDRLRELGPTFHPASGRWRCSQMPEPRKVPGEWMRSRNSQVVCEDHKIEIDGKPFSDVADSFDSTATS